MTEPRDAGPVLDQLGVKLHLGDHDQITDVLVIAKTTDFDNGETGLVLGHNDGLDWIAQYGLLGAAKKILDMAEAEEA